MAHYAFLNEENIVTEVIAGRNENDLVENIISWEDYYGSLRGQRCLRTSYNTYGGVHINGGTPFRGNFAGMGMIYDEDLDAFIDPQPFPSWSLNESTYTWEPPVPRPAMPPINYWDESLGSWVEVE
jgi:hypothetical protein